MRREGGGGEEKEKGGKEKEERGEERRDVKGEKEGERRGGGEEKKKGGEEEMGERSMKRGTDLRLTEEDKWAKMWVIDSPMFEDD
uniref:hypothetical protein n=1 Tax=Salmonella enterica TaxID=28901 RepID=UPI00398C2CEC